MLERLLPARLRRSLRLEGVMCQTEARKAPSRLVYAASARCPCGAGLAYEPRGESGRPITGYWDCAEILLGTATPSGAPGALTHTARLPFVFYEIKSERQPSANGATTRPPRVPATGP